MTHIFPHKVTVAKGDYRCFCNGKAQIDSQRSADSRKNNQDQGIPLARQAFDENSNENAAC